MLVPSAAQSAPVPTYGFRCLLSAGVRHDRPLSGLHTTIRSFLLSCSTSPLLLYNLASLPQGSLPFLPQHPRSLHCSLNTLGRSVPLACLIQLIVLYPNVLLLPSPSSSDHILPSCATKLSNVTPSAGASTTSTPSTLVLPMDNAVTAL